MGSLEVQRQRKDGDNRIQHVKAQLRQRRLPKLVKTPAPKAPKNLSSRLQPHPAQRRTKATNHLGTSARTSSTINLTSRTNAARRRRVTAT